MYSLTNTAGATKSQPILPAVVEAFGVAYVAVSVMWIISIGIPSSLLAILIKVTQGTLANFRQNSKNNMAKIGTPFSYVG